MGLSDEYITKTLLDNIENKATAENYVLRLKKISQLLNKTIYDIIKDPNIESLKKAYPNSVSTQKNMATVIMSVFKNIPGLSQKKNATLNKWKKIHEQLRKEEKEQPSKEVSITREQLLQKYSSIQEPHKTLESSQDYLLLSLAIHASKDFVKIGMMPAQGKISLPSKLADDIAESLRKHHRSHVFVNSKDEPFSNNNAFTVYAGRSLTRLLGTHIGINSLKNVG